MIQDDPEGIHSEVERERLASPYRDRCSRGRVHPIQHDIGRLFDFVVSRRLRQPGVLDLLRRMLHSGDTEAIRLLVDAVLDGSCGVYTRRRCRRLLYYCDVMEAALMIRDWLAEEETPDEPTN